MPFTSHAQNAEDILTAVAGPRVGAQEQEQTRRAELQAAWRHHSPSWRLTVPLRAVSRLLRRGPVRGIRATGGGRPGKEIARQVFHRSMRRLLRLPGGRLAARLTRSVAPGAAEWLALRYRAYERRGAAAVAPPVRAVAAVPGAPLDLSEEEARIHRRFSAGSLAASLDAAPP